MKVKVEFTLDVNVAGYRAEYGEDFPLATIREQVRSDVEQAAREHFREKLGVLFGE